MALLSFVKGATTWQPTRNYLFPDRPHYIRIQVSGITDGDKEYVYDKGGEVRLFPLNFIDTQAKRDSFLSFFRTDVVYGRETFTYNDPDSAAHTVRFVGIDLEAEEVGPSLYSFGVVLREEL